MKNIALYKMLHRQAGLNVSSLKKQKIYNEKILHYKTWLIHKNDFVILYYRKKLCDSSITKENYARKMKKVVFKGQ